MVRTPWEEAIWCIGSSVQNVELDEVLQPNSKKKPFRRGMFALKKITFKICGDWEIHQFLQKVID